MCGVAGFISRQVSSGEADSRLGEMLRRIIHRGPDSEGRLINPEYGVYAGMRRLSVIDLESGNQPIWNEDRTVAVLFNGEIYNYRELRAELIKRNHQFQTNSDTEVLVHLYEEYGCQMFQRLRGMFAITLFDFKKKQLILARDHFGQKPLYFHSSEGLLAWSSELKALLAIPEISREQDPQAFEEFLIWLKVGPGRTHFRDIQKLNPAHYMVCDLESGVVSEPVRYWRYSDTPQVSMEENEAVERLDELMHDSMKMHLRMDVPMGLLLSGGLDSRTIAYYADQNLDQNVRTYTAGFHADEESELETAAETARDINSSGHTEVIVSEKHFQESLEKVAWHLDEPVGDPAAFAVMAVCQRASEDVTVLLGGEGADELFAGYEQFYSGGRTTLARTALYRKIMLGMVSPPKRYPKSKLDRFLYAAGMTPGPRIASLRSLGFPGDVRSPRGLNATQLNQMADLCRQLSNQLYQPHTDVLMELTSFDIEWHLAESLLQKSDKMSMSASVELRCPFLDVELAQFAAQLPPHLKIAPNGVGKYVLLKVMEKRFPHEMSRPKKGFPIPLREWFSGGLRPMIEDLVLADSAQNRQALDGKLLKTAWDDYLAGHLNGDYIFYSLLLYELWYSQMVQSGGSQ